MIHPDRTFCAKAIDSEKDLIEVMTNHKWPLCTAFEFAGFLYLNDGGREDSPEYAAMRIDEVDGLMVMGREAGRIKPLGMDISAMQKFIRDMVQGSWAVDSPLKIKAEPDWHHSCELCRFEEE
ncbi:MAG: hypothetical protein LUO89_05405 [Methanothrix sp.]|jgi:hypothetical protein|nr:hypothetical protein [Methanothrix sp.]